MLKYISYEYKWGNIMPAKKHVSKKQVIYDVLRWLVWMPALLIVWYVAWACGVYTGFRWWGYDMPNWFFVWVASFTLPAVAGFWATKGIAPKYKNICGVVAVILCVALSVLLLNGLAHIAY